MENSNTFYNFNPEELSNAKAWLQLAYGMERGTQDAAIGFAKDMIDNGDTDESTTDLIVSWSNQYQDYLASNHLKAEDLKGQTEWEDSLLNQYS